MSDPFDGLLNSIMDVLEKGVGVGDDYGQPSEDMVVVQSNIKCRLSTQKGGREFEKDKRYAENDYNVYLRPIADFNLSATHWLRVYTESGKIVLLNLKAVNDPSGLGHHLECQGTEIVTDADRVPS